MIVHPGCSTNCTIYLIRKNTWKLPLKKRATINNVYELLQIKVDKNIQVREEVTIITFLASYLANTYPAHKDPRMTPQK